MDCDKVDFLAQTLLKILEGSSKESGGFFQIEVDDVFSIEGSFGANSIAGQLLAALNDYDK
jgi:hypothetical protein